MKIAAAWARTCSVQLDSGNKVITAHSSAGNKPFRARDQLQHFLIMRRHPARQQLRIGKFPSPEEIRSAMDEHWSLLRKRVSGCGVLNFNNQRGGMNFAILIRLGQQFRIKAERPHLMRPDHGSLAQLRAPASNFRRDDLQYGFVRRVGNAQHRDRPVIGSMRGGKRGKNLAASWHIELILHLQR